MPDFLKDQLLEVISYTDDTGKILVHKHRRPGDEIKQGSKLLVREGQAAVFWKGGQLADVFGPGTHTLETKNLPVLSSLGAFAYGFESPIKSDLFFVSTRQMVDNKWATKNPIPMRDTDMGVVRLRGFGKFSFRVTDPALFVSALVGARGMFMTWDIIQYLAAMLTQTLASTIAAAGTPVLDLVTQYPKLSEEILEHLNEQCAAMGMQFMAVLVESLSLPDEVEKMLDEHSGIGMAGKNMDAYLQYQTARAMRDAANQEGGLAGLGAGVAVAGKIAEGMGPAGVALKASGEQAATAPPEAAYLRELKALVEEGVLSEEEFQAKKKQILGL